MWGAQHLEVEAVLTESIPRRGTLQEPCVELANHFMLDHLRPMVLSGMHTLCHLVELGTTLLVNRCGASRWHRECSGCNPGCSSRTCSCSMSNSSHLSRLDACHGRDQ